MSMFSTTIKVPVSVLSDAATKLLGYADDNQDIFDRISNTLSNLEGSGEWKGDSMVALKAATASNKGKYGEAVNELYNLAGFLENYAREMEAKDQEIKSQIGAV